MRILTVNRGSSSLKFALFQAAASESPVLTGTLERVGSAEGVFRATSAAAGTLIDRRVAWPSARLAQVVADWLRGRAETRDLAGIGHRVVHGGGRFIDPQLVTPAVRAALDEIVSFAPEHLPGEVEAIDTFAETFPAVPQVACFDTAFHRRMPAVAQTYALPPTEGVIRYGFHGLSYEYILEELARLGEPAATRGRVIAAHLGSGASMAAVCDGVGVDTTMGFTPAGGLVMGTRSGDLDPGVLVYLLRDRRLDAAGLSALVNEQAGLLGVSGISADMRELLARGHEDARAALAVDLFCYHARKAVGSLAAVLGGVDCLVFTGGIGANAPAVRERICGGLGFLGIEVAAARNAANDALISPDGGRVPVRVMQTDEQLMVARHARRVLAR